MSYISNVLPQTPQVQGVPTGSVNPILKNQLFEYYFGIYHDANRTNQAVNEFLNYYNSQPSATSTTDPNGFLRNYLTSGITNGLPQRGQLENYAKNILGQNTNKQLLNQSQRLASTGLNRTGIGVAAENQIYEGQSQALGNIENNLNNQDIRFRENAIGNLLGLDRLNLSALGLDRDYENQLMRFSEGARQYNSQADMQPSAAGSIFGKLLGAGATIGAAALSGRKLSDRKLKDNIKYIGFSKNKIPIAEFTYKGNDTKYIGVIAQDIEKDYPEAVINNEGTLYVDYSKIDVEFKEVI